MEDIAARLVQVPGVVGVSQREGRPRGGRGAAADAVRLRARATALLARLGGTEEELAHSVREAERLVDEVGAVVGTAGSVEAPVEGPSEDPVEGLAEGSAEGPSVGTDK
ncbi:hypothetical protein ACIGW8_11900 [Streptomyces sioyaensis]|uniref:hypothetical protein n=1 Tax=Streptomyces sioyaensis TaxID=67364 RepID=UPI0037D18D10